MSKQLNVIKEIIMCLVLKYFEMSQMPTYKKIGCGYFDCTVKIMNAVILTDNYAAPAGRRVRTRDRLLANEIMLSDVAMRPQ